jgi:hypothetical protein
LARSQPMNFGPRNMSRVAAEMAAIRTLGTLSPRRRPRARWRRRCARAPSSATP